MTEDQQEIGREGVKRVRRLLDGTMRFRLPYDAYGNPERVLLPLLPEGKRKSYDLRGICLDEGGQEGPEIYVESKNVLDAGQQGAEFKEFLARSYSATMKSKIDLGTDPKLEFMWATTCPWKGSGFRDVASRTMLEEAISAAGPDIIPQGHDVDRDVAEAVAQRLWVWVISDRHEEMVMGGLMRGWVAAKLEERR